MSLILNRCSLWTKLILNFEFVTLSTPLFTRDTYETYICTKLKEDMKTKVIICENPIEQKMK